MRWLKIVALISFISVGCVNLADYWPVDVPQDALNYIGKDPNEFGLLQTMGEVKAVREAVITKHIVTQIDFGHEMEKDKALYGRAIEQANLNVRMGEAERERIIGTIENPGWLTSIILGASGFGLYFAGYKKKRPGDYDEQELEAELVKRTGTQG